VDAVKEFLEQHRQDVIGVLSGFDRLMFRGTIRQLAHVSGMMAYLNVVGVRLKDFARHVLEVSRQLKEGVEARVTSAGRPILYLPSSQESKGSRARAIAQRDGVAEGIICLFRTLEAGASYEVHRDRVRRSIELQARTRRCLFLYLYQVHPRVGFMHVRIQSWFPFSVQIWINGREWLARQMDQAGLGYVRADNCFVRLQDVGRAQRLMDRQLQVNWPALLDQLLDQVFPVRREVFGRFSAPYYWSVYQNEWATDVMFRDPLKLAQLYPRLVQHGIRSFSSPDVMRFLGRRINLQRGIDPRFQGEIVSDLKQRQEGVRIKHWVGGNSIKLYDKQGSVLRFETTIHQPKDLKVFRTKEGQPNSPKRWLKLRRGIADLYRRAEVCQAINDRYAQALACVSSPQPSLGEIAAMLAQPVTFHGKRVRGLRPWSPDDLALLRTVSRGEFTLTGLRNHDLCRLLYPKPADSLQEHRRRSSRITRLLRLLRAHAILKKLPGTHRYLMTKKGRRCITPFLLASAATSEQLNRLAA
jgi:hypothetical protein